MPNPEEILNRNIALLSQKTEAESSIIPDNSEQWPSVDTLQEIVRLAKVVMFPDFFGSLAGSHVRSYHIGVNMDALFTLLKKQIDEEKALAFIDRLPELKRILYTDVKAMHDNDPAVESYGEVIFCYPVIEAMIHYRIAHELHGMGIPVVPRIITEMAHSKTGIDIHPGARIGEYFSIDHGTGVVIGETCIIGNHVTLYQGVTLGAKNFRYDEKGCPIDEPRHPIIEDNVTIYSNSSILGRITVGHDSIIGGNIWLTHDVAPYSRIVQGGTQDGKKSI